MSPSELSTHDLYVQKHVLCVYDKIKSNSECHLAGAALFFINITLTLSPESKENRPAPCPHYGLKAWVSCDGHHFWHIEQFMHPLWFNQNILFSFFLTGLTSLFPLPEEALCMPQARTVELGCLKAEGKLHLYRVNRHDLSWTVGDQGKISPLEVRLEPCSSWFTAWRRVTI